MSVSLQSYRESLAQISRAVYIATMADDMAAEVTAETVKNEETEVKHDAEVKEEKTPETPVTEPITNGSNTPESPKEEVVAKEVVPVTNVESDKPETKKEPEPEQLPINGLSIVEPVKEEPEETVQEVTKMEENKSEESPAETTETVPAVEIPVQNEVCVEQMPLIESTPPPLPANPPPSSVATFAATTMAPDLTDASLANTTQTAISTPPTDTKAELPKECLSESSHTVITNNESDTHVPSSTKTSQEEVNATRDSVEENLETPVSVEQEADSEVKKDDTDIKEVEENIKIEVELNGSEPEILKTPVLPESPTLPETLDSETSDTTGDLPPPPPPEEDDDTLNDDVAIEKIEPPTIDELQEANNVIDANMGTNGDVVVSNGIDKEETFNGNLETPLKAVNADVLKSAVVECNGNTLEECEAEESSAPQPARASPPPASQEPIVVSDKIADLIPEVPVVPDLNTETLQETSDVVVAN